MIIDIPFWFRQRQAKLDELSTAQFKITGPNLPEAVIAIRIGDNLKWQGQLLAKENGSEINATGYEFSAPRDALAAAFELYRERFVV